MDQLPIYQKQSAFVVLSVLILTGISTYLFMPQTAHGTNDCSTQLATVSSLAEQTGSQNSTIAAINSSLTAEESSISSIFADYDAVSDNIVAAINNQTITTSMASSGLDALDNYSSAASVHENIRSSLEDTFASNADTNNYEAFSSAISAYDACINN